MRSLLSGLILVLLHSSIGQTNAAHFPKAHEQRRQDFLNLSRKIFAPPDATPTERISINAVPTKAVEEVTAELHNLIAADIEDSLAEKNANAQQISKAIQDLAGESCIDQ